MNWEEMLRNAITEQQSIVNKAEGEKRALNAEEQEKFDTLQDSINDLNKSIELKNAIQTELKNGITIPQSAGARAPENAVDSSEYKNAWLNYTRGLPLNAAEQKVFADANLKNAATGEGVFVPTTIASDIISLIQEEHPILADVTNMSVKGNFTINIHTGITENDADVVTQGDELKGEKNSFVSVSLGGYSYGKLVEIPWQMRAMAIPAYEEYLRGELVSRLGSVIATDIFYGKGARVTGLTSSFDVVSGEDEDAETKTVAIEVVEFTTLAYTDFIKAMSNTSKPKGTRVIYASEETYWAHMMNILDGQKRPLFFNDPGTNKLTSIFGVEVKPESALKKGHIVVGKPKVGYIVNWNKDMSVVAQDNARRLQTDVVGWCIVDGHPVTEKAWCLMKPKNETAG